VRNKSNIVTKDVFNLTPVLLALHGDALEDFTVKLVKFLNGRIDLKNQLDNENNNLLHIATKNGRFNLIQTLIEELGFNVNDLNSEVRNLLLSF